MWAANLVDGEDDSWVAARVEKMGDLLVACWGINTAAPRVAMMVVEKVPAIVGYLDYVKVYSMVDVLALLKADC